MNRREFVGSSAAALTVASLGTSRTFAQSSAQMPTADAMTGDDPMAAAEYLSFLETMEHMPMLYELYGYMHPDAEALARRRTVISWYQEDFQALGPQVAVATEVTMLDEWTWEPLGTTYTNVAEVSYTQEFTNAETVNDVVRLVFHEGSWRWWFGRDADWIHEQYVRFSEMENVPEAESAPYGMDKLTAIDPGLLDVVPAEVTSNSQVWEPVSIPLSEPWLGGSLQPEDAIAYQTPTVEFDLGWITVGSSAESYEDGMIIKQIADYVENLPPSSILGWNSVPAEGPAWLLVENVVGEAYGTLHSLYLVLNNTYLDLTFQNLEDLELVAEAISQNM